MTPPWLRIAFSALCGAEARAAESLDARKAFLRLGARATKDAFAEEPDFELETAACEEWLSGATL